MHPFEKEFQHLFEKYTELLTGQSSSETIEKVKIWALYSHMNKTMPALLQHWHQDNPESRTKMKQLFEEVQHLNKSHKTQS
ncbi:DUF2573 family protein [Caldalkalibacillus mannanilyticus]|uniref:DUF2573 family protein n=1 Tax=Caldalkalibacillus mannanilyticus TaxID=1418 RepID=UPI0004693BB9|nr:DUF2573 family protein [Caldalkalibacillus mannanilyticus]